MSLSNQQTLDVHPNQKWYQKYCTFGAVVDKLVSVSEQTNREIMLVITTNKWNQVLLDLFTFIEIALEEESKNIMTFVTPLELYQLKISAFITLLGLYK